MDAPFEVDGADYALAFDFRELSRDEQAVLAFSALLGSRDWSGEARIKHVAQYLGMAEDAVLEIIASLYDKGLAWRCGPYLSNLDCVDTRVGVLLRMLAVGPGGRPNARDWGELREVVFSELFQHITPHCFYCKEEAEDLVLDHAVPVSRGGSNHPTNLVPACARCNGQKGKLSYYEFVERRRSAAQ